MKRYKVAIVSDTFLPQVGGLEVHMHDLAEELTRQGHEVHVICAVYHWLRASGLGFG